MEHPSTATISGMEILLLEDISGIGKKNDLLVVGDGFALNHLLPSRRALVATPTVRKRYAEQIKRRAEEKEHEKQMRTQAASALAGKTVEFTRKATKTGKLYAAITDEAIVEALKDQLAIVVDAKDIDIKDHIKAVGTVQVMVKTDGSSYPLNVSVKAE